GTHDDEAGSSRPKQTRHHETVEEVMLLRVHHEFLLWGTSNRVAKTRYNTNLARLLPKQIYSPYVVDWGLLNNMGCAEEIEEILEIKVVTLYVFQGASKVGVNAEFGNLPVALNLKTELDATTLRELVDSNRRLIAKDPTPGVPRVAMPRGPCPFMEDLYDQIGNMEIRHGVLERMARKQSYHLDRYNGVFKYMAGQYNVPVQGAYAPPGYDEEQQED
ncbi:hypothetical protein Tco_1407798, partial [Tanacetum coccineum]